jgi:hypothetical protein
MGLLDDAIREHLDLKRQRGADPGEVERLEHEALGPVRHEPTGSGGDAVPYLAVHADPELYSEPATELYAQPAVEPPHENGRTREPKRGFLRRNRSAPAPEPEQSDFAEHLEAGMHREADATHADLFAHDDPFAHEDPFGHDDETSHDDPFAQQDPATSAHAGPAVAGEPPPAAAPADVEGSVEPAAPAEPVTPGEPVVRAEAALPPAPAAPTEPAVETEPPHLIFDGVPPPPQRPTFVPVPPSIAGPEPAPTAPGLDDRARADAARETREWSIEDAFAVEDASSSEPAAEPAEEDVLEETPEFLQDTPDHDRLWFEQRPPRDFDFDG